MFESIGDNPIATYVFLDLETTGIPKQENNKTRITELSMVAVKRRHLLECRPGDMPRVQQKITLCVNPMRVMQPGASDASGLCNFLLEHEPHFSTRLCSMLQTFLSLLTKPVCLIAQNGFSFDYPLLKNHMERVKESFSDDLLCADSLHAFYDIEFNCSTIQQPIQNSIEMNRQHEEKQSELNLVNETTPISSDTCDSIALCQGNMQFANERTPKKQLVSLNAVRNHKRHLENKLSHSKVKRKLFWGVNEKPKQKYELKDIYERLLNTRPTDCHRAETDSILLLKCAVAVSERFVPWVDANHCLFREVKPMRIGVPFGD